MPTNHVFALVFAVASLLLLAGAVVQYRDGRRTRPEMFTATGASMTTLAAASVLAFT